MLLLLLCLTLTLSGSFNQNKFSFLSPEMINFGQKENEITIPERSFVPFEADQAPGPDGLMTTENAEKVKMLLRGGQADLGFISLWSVQYFLLHIVKIGKIEDRALYSDCLSLFFSDILLIPRFPSGKKKQTSAQTSTVISKQNHYSIKLLKALEAASNQVNIDNIDEFFKKTLEIFNNLKAVKKSTIRPNKPLDSVLSTLKHAFIFNWKTLRVWPSEYSDEQKREYQGNSSYIRLIRFLNLSLILGAVGTFIYRLFGKYHHHS